MYDIAQGDKDRGSNAADAAIAVLSDVALQLAWRHYQQLLGRFMRTMGREGDSNKAQLASLVCIRARRHC